MSREKLKAVENITNADSIKLLSCADILNGRDDKVILFTPALLFMAGFDRDPVQEFNARFPATDADCRPFLIRLTHNKKDEQFFHGIGYGRIPGKPEIIDWDRTLYTFDARRQEELFEFLAGITFAQSKLNYYGQTFLYSLDIADPTSRKNDRLVVVIVGVMTNKHIIYLAPHPTTCPQLKIVPNVNGQLPLELLSFTAGARLDQENPLIAE